MDERLPTPLVVEGGGEGEGDSHEFPPLWQGIRQYYPRPLPPPPASLALSDSHRNPPLVEKCFSFFKTYISGHCISI